MKKFKEIDKIVLDADIAKSAGAVSLHPRSKSSRDILQAIWEDPDIQIVFCKELSDEWKKHATNFSAEWLASMAGQGRKKTIVKIENKFVKYLNTISNLTAKEINAITKDAHLIETALQAKKFLISNDTTARNICCKIAVNYYELESFCWVIASNDSVKLVQLIRDGGYIPKSFMVRQ